MRKQINQRQKAKILAAVVTVVLAAVTVCGILFTEAAMETDFLSRNQAPSAAHIFGTDWMGRDMLFRTLAGLSLSIRIGLLTAAISGAAALLIGIGAAVLGRKADACISWCIDLVMGIPHILLVMLISIVCGRGFTGVCRGGTDPLAVACESYKGRGAAASPGSLYPCGREAGSVKR